jgi:opacity protein-like surface antigen
LLSQRTCRDPSIPRLPWFIPRRRRAGADAISVAISARDGAFPGITAAYQLKNTEDLTARRGYVIAPAVLAYVKGCIAWANTDVSALALPKLAESANPTRTGYTVGGGLEWKFAPN